MIMELKQRLRRFIRSQMTRYDFALDSWRYVRHSAPMDNDLSTDSLSRRHLEAQLTKDYHRVEKALALRNPKSPFGRDVEGRLSSLTRSGNASSSDPFLTYANEALTAQKRWNSEGVRETNVTISSGDLPRFSVATEELSNFFTSRRSVRDFDETRDVAEQLLAQATQWAINTPSVCNRQAWRVRYFADDMVQQVLRHQNGNSGFRDSVPCVAVVTVDARLFAGPGERNQPWIEGGLFSMSLVWALHGLGLATCMLNWSMTNKQSEELRRAIQLDPSELIIMMIAIGYASDQHRVARSPRRSVGEVMTVASGSPS